MDENLNQPNSEKDELHVLETYSSDMADAVRENEMSVIKIAMAEKERREQEGRIVVPGESSTTKFFLIFFGIILVLGSIGGLYYFTQIKSKVVAPLVVVKEIKTIIPYDEKSAMNITDKTNISGITNIIDSEKIKIGKSKSIRAILLTETINNSQELLPLKDILSLSDTNIPASISRSLSGEYMIGVFTPVIKVETIANDTSSSDNTTRPSLFLILKTSNYNITYVGMLDWEKTMKDDLKNLFSDSQSAGLGIDNSFRDIIISNKDARVLYNAHGEGVLYYLFTDKNTLIITDNMDTVKELITRLIVATR